VITGSAVGVGASTPGVVVTTTGVCVVSFNAS